MTKLEEKTPHFTQSALYRGWQESAGRVVKVFSLTDGENQLAWQSICYPLLLGKSYWSIPHGPVIVGELTEKLVRDFKEVNQKLLGETKAIFLRFDPFPKDDKNTKLWQKYFNPAPDFSYKSSFIQSSADWILDITKSEEDLLKEMHEKTRYGINLAKRKEVVVEKIAGPDMDKHFNDFYKLMSETANRNSFRLHPKNYYEAIWNSAKDSDQLNLFIAKYQNQILAMHLILFFGDTAYYPFGASSNVGREKMPTQLLHWEAIREAKRQGYRWYNFGAIETSTHKSGHQWSGLSAYKKRFGGQTLSYSPLFDLVSKPLWYWLYNLRRKLKK